MNPSCLLPPPSQAMRIVSFFGHWLCNCGKESALWDTCVCGQACTPLHSDLQVTVHTLAHNIVPSTAKLRSSSSSPFILTLHYCRASVSAPVTEPLSYSMLCVCKCCLMTWLTRYHHLCWPPRRCSNKLSVGGTPDEVQTNTAGGSLPGLGAGAVSVWHRVPIPTPPFRPAGVCTSAEGPHR